MHVKGSFDHAKERYLYALSNDGEPGWHVITPFDSAEGDLVLIDRGFVPDNLRDPSFRAASQSSRDTTSGWGISRSDIRFLPNRTG